MCYSDAELMAMRIRDRHNREVLEKAERARIAALTERETELVMHQVPAPVRKTEKV
jgi:hypothetical protein